MGDHCLGYPDPLAIGSCPDWSSNWLVSNIPFVVEFHRANSSRYRSRVVRLVSCIPFHELPRFGARQLYSATSSHRRAIQDISEPNVCIRFIHVVWMDDFLRQSSSLYGVFATLVHIYISCDSSRRTAVRSVIW